jgi:hypothetical protein
MTSLRKIKLKLAVPKPRNPLVAPAAQRKAGAHVKTQRRDRQEARRHIDRALKESS